MPLIYEKQCTACDHREHESTDYYTSILLDDGSEAVLHHPGEEWDLQKTGLTRKEAIAQGRWIENRPNMCLRCGGLYVARSLSAGTGCLIFVLVLIGAAAAGLVVGRQSFGWGMAAFFTLFFVGSKLGGMIDRARSNRLNARFGGRVHDTTCCDSPDLVALNKWSKKHRAPCSECGETAAVVRWVGKS